LKRLIKIANLHSLYAPSASRLQQQQGWLIDLQHLLKPAQTPPAAAPTAQAVESQVDDYLTQLSQRQDLDQTDQTVANHIVTTFRNRWWGLFVCYQVPGLPTTNNDLESFFGRLKTNQRRITGRKSVNSFVLRYGAYAAFVDLTETKAELLLRLRQVDPAAFQRERQQLHHILVQQRDYHRFCHNLEAVVQQLEAEWLAAVAVATRSIEPKVLP